MMEKTMQINGMMCNHCKMTVEKALKAVSGVENVEVDLAAKCAKITLCLLYTSPSPRDCS